MYYFNAKKISDGKPGSVDAQIADIPGLLQPVAHALLQAREEIIEYTKDFPTPLLWIKPGGVASVGFHLQHLCGILDRLLTYADGRPLTHEQFEYLKQEGVPNELLTTGILVKKFEEQVDLALQQLKNIDEATLLDSRGIGRAQIPTTVIGLLFHAAEHAQRHVGQLRVTIKLLPFIKTA